MLDHVQSSNFSVRVRKNARKQSRGLPMANSASTEVATPNATFNTIISIVALVAIVVLIYFIVRGRTTNQAETGLEAPKTTTQQCL